MRRMLRTAGPVLAALAALGACGGEVSAPPAAQGDDPAAAEPEAIRVSGPSVRILAFGDSLFAGYNLAGDEGYPEVLEADLRRRGIDARVVDAGVSGDTTGAGRQRLGFVLENAGGEIDLALVELGGNDILRGLPPAETRANLAAILAELDQRRIPVVLMGMRAPPNLGADYVSAFDAIYPALAKRYNAALVPFFLEPIYNRPQLIQRDRVHPTAPGIEALVAASIDQVVEALPQEAQE